MTPFYDHDGITLFHGDCRHILPALDAEIADVVILDPPYGDTSLEWDRPIPDLALRMLPMLKRGGSLWCFGSMRMFLDQRIDFAGWSFAQDLVWEKHNGSGFHADRFRRVHEHALQFYPAGVPWGEVFKAPVTTPDATARTVRRKSRPAHTGNIGASAYASEDGGPRLMRSVVYVPSCHGVADNETQKPDGIVRPPIEFSCPPGGLVLDPTAGAGTSLVVARDTGRRAIGIELRRDQCEAIVRRLSQGSLFGKGAA